jgi:hypothetical protein
MRAAPQVGFSDTIREMSSRISLLTDFRPARRRERQRQYLRNPTRCHSTTVSEVTRTREFFQCDQMLFIPIQNSLSNGASIGLCFRCLKTNSCWRRARFSNRRSRREQKQRKSRPKKSLSRRRMSLIYIRSWGKIIERKLLQTRHVRILARDTRASSRDAKRYAQHPNSVSISARYQTARTAIRVFLLRLVINHQGRVRLDAPPACDLVSRQDMKTHNPSIPTNLSPGFPPLPE